MISRRNVILLTVTSLVAATPAAARAKRSSPVARLDADNDGTVDLAEAKKAAGDVFDKLDTDKEGTVSLKELGGRLSNKDFSTADPDHDNPGTQFFHRRRTDVDAHEMLSSGRRGRNCDALLP